MHKVVMLLETLLKFVDAGCFPSDLSSKDGFAPFLYVQPIIEKVIYNNDTKILYWTITRCQEFL